MDLAALFAVALSAPIFNPAATFGIWPGTVGPQANRGDRSELRLSRGDVKVLGRSVSRPLFSKRSLSPFSGMCASGSMVL
jgi:hypothetical protein